ncbi:MAG TPA: serine/threonine-protein kinase, partial [Allocoleopsis sp.]
MTWNPGKTLKNRTYTILSELGRGGFAITYLVQDTHGRKFVIKTLNDEIISHPDFKTFQDNFHKEATSLAQFNHPHIVQIDSLFYESEQNQVICCLVMDYIQGENLHQLSQGIGILSESLAEIYIKQIAEALILIHSKNILHRDVKPENIMISNITSQAILIDFGIAREFTPNQAKNHTQFWSDGYSP